MKEYIRRVEHIREYDELVGAETLHPLVNVVDFSRLPPIRNISFKRLFGYYAVYLKGRMYSELHYGRSGYSYQEGEMVFIAPGQVAGVEDDGVTRQLTTHVLMFHPDLLHGTYLQPLMSCYTYFSYNTNEALLPTEEEKHIIKDCFNHIEEELRRNDECSLEIVIDYIKLVLDYCTRFYRRYFSANKPQNKDILAHLEQLLDAYFYSDASIKYGVPTVAYCADKLCLSSNYFNDLVRSATGISALKLIHGKMLEVAKEKLSDPMKRVNEVAAEMGFQQPQNFSNWFRKMEGCTALQYQKAVTGKNHNM
ncbi:helix-turn-helix domain-containing protein [Parabacteroides merdae]|uniref:helix-turn-helix domain-containing protein n=1 Tax=Parabacteroides merdae TaxID=46503 RepID=UPI0034A520E0